MTSYENYYCRPGRQSFGHCRAVSVLFSCFLWKFVIDSVFFFFSMYVCVMCPSHPCDLRDLHVRMHKVSLRHVADLKSRGVSQV